MNKNNLKNDNTLNIKNVLTFDETSVYTGISKSYLYKLTSKRQIPHYKPTGKLIFFKLDELERWLLSHRIGTREELKQLTSWESKKMTLGSC